MFNECKVCPWFPILSGFQNSQRGLLNIKPCDVCLLPRGHSPRYDYNFFSHREGIPLERVRNAHQKVWVEILRGPIWTWVTFYLTLKERIVSSHTRYKGIWRHLVLLYYFTFLCTWAWKVPEDPKEDWNLKFSPLSEMRASLFISYGVLTSPPSLLDSNVRSWWALIWNQEGFHYSKSSISVT